MGGSRPVNFGQEVLMNWISVFLETSPRIIGLSFDSRNCMIASSIMPIVHALFCCLNMTVDMTWWPPLSVTITTHHLRHHRRDNIQQPGGDYVGKYHLPSYGIRAYIRLTPLDLLVCLHLANLCTRPDYCSPHVNYESTKISECQPKCR